VGGQVQIAIFPGHLTQRLFRRLSAAQEGCSELGKLLLERVANRRDFDAHSIQPLELRLKPGASADGSRPARATVCARAGVAAVIDVADQQ
jgi:hypothetical protein